MTFSSDLVAALNAQRAAGANVVNMSLGGAPPSSLEEQAFAEAYGGGMLLVAAAGNSGGTEVNYPAGYASVISVAALDSNKTHAAFSTRNADVELARCPGVGVRSTLPWKDTNTLTAGDTTWSDGRLTGAAHTSAATGTIVDGGICDAAGERSAMVVLCQRGSIGFAQKVSNVKAGGGVAAVIYNNVAGGFDGTLSGTSTIPTISLSDTDGAAAGTQGGNPGTVVSIIEKPTSGYGSW